MNIEQLLDKTLDKWYKEGSLYNSKGDNIGYWIRTGEILQIYVRAPRVYIHTEEGGKNERL